jgi:hypothetical protein
VTDCRILSLSLLGTSVLSLMLVREASRSQRSRGVCSQLAGWSSGINLELNGGSKQ